MNIAMVKKLIETGNVFDEDASNEFKEKYPDTVGIIHRPGGSYVQVLKSDVSEFNKFVIKCKKNSLSVLDELIKYYEKHTENTSFHSEKGRKILRDLPFNCA